MSDTDKIREVFAAIRNDLGPVDVLVYSASSRFKAQGSQGNIEVCTEEDMERAWKIDTLGNWEMLFWETTRCLTKYGLSDCVNPHPAF